MAQVETLGTLDGSASSDPSGKLPLTYAWSFVSKPAGSAATLSNPNIVNPTFTADALGNYLIQLVVTDAAGLSSAPATVTIVCAGQSVSRAVIDRCVTRRAGWKGGRPVSLNLRGAFVGYHPIELLSSNNPLCFTIACHVRFRSNGVTHKPKSNSYDRPVAY